MTTIQIRKLQNKKFHIDFLSRFRDKLYPGEIPYIVFYQSKRIGILILQDHTSFLSCEIFCIDKVKESTLYELIERIEKTVFIDKKKILLSIQTNSSLLLNILKQTYHPVGNSYLRMISSSDKILLSTCVDACGYIIHQGNMSMSFSKYTVREKGCGLIATYNVMKLYHTQVDFNTLKKEYENHVLFHGLIGISLHRIQKVVKKYGFTYKMYWGKADSLKECTNGILLYFHKEGAHYVTYRKIGKKYLFYNAIYGKQEDLRTMSAFLQRHALIDSGIALDIKDE